MSPEVKFETTSAGRLAVLDPGTVSEQRTGRALLTTDEVRQLPKTDQLLFITARPPIRATKLRYYADAEFSGLFDPAE